MDIPESIMLAIVTSILGGIGYGFKVLYMRITSAADKCEKDREQLWIKTNDLSGKVKDLEERLEDCPAIDCPAHPKPNPIYPQRIPLQPRPFTPPATA